MKKEILDFSSRKPPRSQRRYAKRQCKNPNCGHEPEFDPHDARQEFCCIDCRTNYFNDHRRKLDHTKYADVKLIKSYDDILKKMFKKTVDADVYCCIHKDYFMWEQIDLSLIIRVDINSKTQGKIHWLFSFGVERHPTKPDFFIIHKRDI